MKWEKGNAVRWILVNFKNDNAFILEKYKAYLKWGYMELHIEVGTSNDDVNVQMASNTTWINVKNINDVLTLAIIVIVVLPLDQHHLGIEKKDHLVDIGCNL